jgi:hypothetical protein
VRLTASCSLLGALILLATSAVRGQDAGTVVKVGSLKAAAPADWKKEKPSNLLRSYQFKLPGAQDMPNAEVAVYPEANPNPEKNFPKWKTQFVPPEGKAVDDISKTGKWDLKGATVTYLDVTGTWKYKERPQDPASKEMLLENYRVVWVIVAEKDEATMIRLSGPAESVAKQYKAFEDWVKSLKG